jgi:hypothetical protein
MRFPWGRLAVDRRPAASQASYFPAAHDWRGTRYLWIPRPEIGTTRALDVEHLDTPTPSAVLLERRALPEFLRAWTRLEVLAKLLDEPVLACLRRLPLTVPSLDQEEHYHHDGRRFALRSGVWSSRKLVYTCGFRWD